MRKEQGSSRYACDGPYSGTSSARRADDSVFRAVKPYKGGYRGLGTFNRLVYALGASRDEGMRYVREAILARAYAVPISEEQRSIAQRTRAAFRTS
jgi:hypothetical protein